MVSSDEFSAEQRADGVGQLRFVVAGDDGVFLAASSLQHLGLRHHGAELFCQPGGLLGRFDDLSGRDFDSGAVEQSLAFKFVEFHGDSRTISLVNANGSRTD